MASRVDPKGIAFALFFIVVIVVLIDVISPDPIIANFFSGQQTQEGRIERAVRRAVER